MTDQEHSILFNTRFSQIAAIKQQAGMSWEDAYRVVTGNKWPSGRNIKITDQGGQMVKDDPWWKPVVKYGGAAAGLVAAPFTAGATIPLVAGALGGAASGAIDGGWKGAATGGALGAGAGWAAGSLGAGQSAMQAAPPLAGQSAAAGGGSGFMGALGRSAPYWLPTAIGAGTGLLGAAMQSNAANDAAQMQIDAANRAADLEYKGNQEMLDFLKQQDAERHGRLEPYRRFGAGALAHAAQPIYRR